jgi:hypothetical protein
MTTFFKISGSIFFALLAAGSIFYLAKNEPLPKGKQGKEADALAIKMLNALNYETYKNTETITWNFRNEHFYKWNKQKNIVTISWENNKVILHTNNTKKTKAFKDGKKVENTKLIKKATAFFNNDSFWLVAPYKVFDTGSERRIVNYKGEDALLVTYTSGGSTPGDSYLWILNEDYQPTSFKMWTSIIPIGGLSATWTDWKNTESGITLPTKHTLAVLGLEIYMGNVQAVNEKANILANRILKAIHNDAYKKTRFLEWRFAGRRSFKWDKENNIVDVSWDTIRVNLHTRNLEKSTVFFNEKKQKVANAALVKKAWDIFNNDSFWLVAPHKLFEKGIIRTIEKVDGKEALLVKYTTGGSTPGDSYLWLLDTTYVPKSYKMFVPSMKMEGTLATWDDWKATESGTLLPTNHRFSSGNKLSMGTVKGYN